MSGAPFHSLTRGKKKDRWARICRMWSTGLCLLKWYQSQLIERQCFTFAMDSRLSSCPNSSQLFRNLESFLLYLALDLVRKHSVQVSPRRLLISMMTAHFSFDFFPVRILWARILDPLMVIVYRWVLCSTELQLEDTISILAFMISFHMSFLQ